MGLGVVQGGLDGPSVQEPLDQRGRRPRSTTLQGHRLIPNHGVVQRVLDYLWTCAKRNCVFILQYLFLDLYLAHSHVNNLSRGIVCHHFFHMETEISIHIYWNHSLQMNDKISLTKNVIYFATSLSHQRSNKHHILCQYRRRRGVGHLIPC